MLTPLSSGWPRLRILGVEHLDRFFRCSRQWFSAIPTRLNSVAWLMPLMVMFSPSATVLLNTLPGHCWCPVKPSQRPRRATAAPLSAARSASSVAVGWLCPQRDRTASLTTSDDAPAREPVDHCGHVFDAVLAVAVRWQDPPGAVRALLDSSRMAPPPGPIRRMAYEVSTGLLAVGATVITGSGRRLTHIGDDLADPTAASLEGE